jgi:hypothetical protein
MNSVINNTLYYIDSVWITLINNIRFPIIFNNQDYSTVQIINTDNELLHNSELKLNVNSQSELNQQLIVECPICFENIDNNVNRTITPCGHLFHTTCLMIHVCTNNNGHHSYGPDASHVYNKACPCCRTKLISDEINTGTGNDDNNDNNDNNDNDDNDDNDTDSDDNNDNDEEPEPSVDDLFRFIRPTSYELFQILLHMEYSNSSIVQYNNINRYAMFINRIEYARWTLTRRNSIIENDIIME